MTNPLLFLLAAATLVAIPGPNHLFIITRSIAEGRRAGIASALGVETGTLVHVAFAAAGLSALIAASATAFSVVRYAGAAYLVYMAIRAFRSRGGEAADETIEVTPLPLRRVYLDGVLVNVLNPKVILFFLAFLPQFVDRDAGAVPAQIVVMGLVTGLIGVVSDIAYALTADRVAGWLRARPAFRRRQSYATGIIYLGLGAVAVFAGPGHRRA
jgi:threonine/homoserine/homoserine lactone efflux protein